LFLNSIKINKPFIITFIFFIFNNSYSNSNDVYERFKYNSDFTENTLVTHYNESVDGIIEIVSTNKIFGKYNSLKLYKIMQNDIQAGEWLEARLENEIKNIGNIERILRGSDSPLKDSVFDYAKSSLPLIDETIKKASFNPMWFCEHLKKSYNKEGQYFQLYCIFPLGMFKYYLALRLQKIDNMHYYIVINSLNNIRFRNILDIADSFEIQ
tara:strand:+ start:5111 stop:5743 length:633 start_codon:yes stop_codon:yes gene_type:complete